MIEYDGIEKIYSYNKEIVAEINRKLSKIEYRDISLCTQERIKELIANINFFFDSTKLIERKARLKRYETPEEAREYFGEQFIKQFTDLLNTLDKQDTSVFLHGTGTENCPSICENGLKSQLPNLLTTSLPVEKNFRGYVTLRNWPHRGLEGIVILAIPYECYYREGIWTEVSDKVSDFDRYDYKITPDFIAGYIDVNQRSLILNSKYNRNHNYDGNLPDAGIFSEISDMDNERFREMKEKNLASATEEGMYTENQINEEESNEEDKLELDAFPQLMQNLQEEFAGRDYYDSMDEEQYKSFSERVTSKLKILQKFMPFLKTDAQLLLEQEIKEQQLAQAREEAIQESDDDWLSSDSGNSDIDWWEEKESGFIEDKVGSHNK
jgi:hypothetical protein